MSPGTNGRQPRFIYEFGPFRLDVENQRLLKGGEPVSLKRKAVEMLVVLVEHRGRVVEKEALLRTLWPDSFVEESNLTQYVYLLRKALGDGYIATISGRGYRFTSEALERPEAVEPTEPEVLAPVGWGDTGPAESMASTVRPSSAPIDELALPNGKGHHRVSLLAVPVLLSLGAGVGYWRGFLPPMTADAPPRVVVATSFPGSESQPAFSPDGKQIAFVWSGENGDQPDVYVKLLDVGDPLRLTNDPAAERLPVWSPDGRFVAFVREVAPTGHDLVVVPALGGSERHLGRVDSGLDWSPDGRTLAVVDQRAIALLSIESGQRRTVTTPPKHTLSDMRPAFSHDGRKLAFVRSDGGTESLYVLALPDGESRQLTFENGRIQSVRWTLDDHHLIYASNRAGPQQLWKISEAGGTPEPLAVAGDGEDVAISPDGSRLAFVRGWWDTNIWRLELNGTSPGPFGTPGWTRLLASSRADDSPQYSPDGRRIAFASQRSGYEEIWVCSNDGSNAFQVTQIAGASTGSPRWSPDGRQLVFDSRLRGQSDIFVVDAEGGAPRRLTDHPAVDVVPSWSSDGRWIYFSSLRTGARQIWKVPPEGGAAVQVTDRGGFDSFESTDGQYLYYTKQREIPGVWRRPAGGGDETLIGGLQAVQSHRSWTHANGGIYFVASAEGGPVLRFFDLATSEVADITRLQTKPVSGPSGLAVSPDGRSVLYVQRDSFSSDIVMLENFR